MTPVAMLTRRAGRLVAVRPGPCGTCPVARDVCDEFGCPRVPEPLPPDPRDVPEEP